MNNSSSSDSIKHIDLRRVKALLVQQGEQGWNVSDLARAIGHTPQAVHNVLTGRRPYSDTIVPKIAKRLGVREEEILLKAKRPSRKRKPAVRPSSSSSGERGSAPLAASAHEVQQ